MYYYEVLSETTPSWLESCFKSSIERTYVVNWSEVKLNDIEYRGARAINGTEMWSSWRNFDDADELLITGVHDILVSSIKRWKLT